MERFSLAVAVVYTLALLFQSSFCNYQYVTLYTDPNQEGDHLTLDRHYANLSEHHDFLTNASSFCAVGWISFYTNVNYNIEGGVAFLIDQNDATPKCQNRIFSNFNSMRYLGNRNTDAPGLSMYSKASYHGAEVFVHENGTLSAEITFPVLSLVSTGWSNYTLYEGTNFNGSSWCVASTKKVNLVAEIDASLSHVGSVSLGCDSNSTKVIIH